MAQRFFQMADPDIHKTVIFSGALQHGNALNPRLGENGFPGILFIAGHVVLGVVAGHGHEGYQVGFGYSLLDNQILDQIHIRIPLDGTHKNICVPELQLKT